MNPVETGTVVSKLPGWLYRARDAAEFVKHIPRNSPVSAVVHTLMGMGLAAGATLGVAALLPEHDPKNPDRWDKVSYLNASRNAVAGAAAIGAVFTTLGMQRNTPQMTTLARGINPIYFLGVGAAAFAYFGVGKFTQAYEN
jgi:hypothetical protein